MEMVGFFLEVGSDNHLLMSRGLPTLGPFAQQTDIHNTFKLSSGGRKNQQSFISDRGKSLPKWQHPS